VQFILNLFAVAARQPRWRNSASTAKRLAASAKSSSALM
jgi:hypothetical protein